MKPSIRWIAFAALAALVVSGARPYAGGRNDGSRLAAVESLVDRGTFVVDDSMFLKVPPEAWFAHGDPYPPGEKTLFGYGTGDKVFIEGHYYSDKPPTHSLLMAAVYLGAQKTTGLVARERPDIFCRLLTILFAGLPYLVSVLVLDRVMRGTAPRRTDLLVTSFALGTLALGYTRHVNVHVLVLALVSILVLELADRRRPLVLGVLCGLTYALEAGFGPLLLVATAFLLATRAGGFARDRVRMLALFAIGAFPAALLHHGLNYAIAGTLRPMGYFPAHFRWPGSPFDEETMTGPFGRREVLRTALYMLEMLLGRHGFLLYNPPVMLAAGGFVVLLRRRIAEQAEVLWVLAISVATWLLYGTGSVDYSGYTTSIRWFLPLLAPAFWILALLLRERDELATDLALLTVWGVGVGIWAFANGPWTPTPYPYQTGVAVGVLLSWSLLAGWRLGRRST